MIPIDTQTARYFSNHKSALQPIYDLSSTCVRDFVSGPILARPRKREFMEAGKIRPDLRLRFLKSFRCGRTKKEGFEYDNVMHHLLLV